MLAGFGGSRSASCVIGFGVNFGSALASAFGSVLGSGGVSWRGWTAGVDGRACGPAVYSVLSMLSAGLSIPSCVGIGASPVAGRGEAARVSLSDSKTESSGGLSAR